MLRHAFIVHEDKQEDEITFCYGEREHEQFW